MPFLPAQTAPSLPNCVCSAAMSTVVVYVHGLWLTGIEGVFLRKRLGKDLKAQTRAFSYASVSSSISANARALGTFLNAIRADTLHLVGHSLGGLVILKLFETGEGARLPPGRLVFLGSPLNGSRAALNLARVPFGKSLLGRGVEEELLEFRGHGVGTGSESSASSPVI